MSENTKNTQKYPPLVVTSARIYPANGSGNTLAYATATLNDAFAIHNLRVVQGKDGPFVSMPQKELKSGEYKDMCHPCTKEFRIEFNDAVLDAYEKWLEEGSVNG